MDINRYDKLLFNAIDLLKCHMSTDEIIEELGMTNEEYNKVGEQFDDICQYAIDIVSKHDEDFENTIPEILENAGYEVMGCVWKATWSRKGYHNGEPPLSSD